MEKSREIIIRDLIERNKENIYAFIEDVTEAMFQLNYSIEYEPLNPSQKENLLTEIQKNEDILEMLARLGYI